MATTRVYKIGEHSYALFDNLLDGQQEYSVVIDACGEVFLRHNSETTIKWRGIYKKAIDQMDADIIIHKQQIILLKADRIKLRQQGIDQFEVKNNKGL